MPASHAVLALVDDAGLFPPTALPMADALARHREDDAAASPVLTHRLLVPASRVGELLDTLDERTLEVGLVVDVPLEQVADAVARLADDPRTSVTAVELRLPAGDPADAVRTVQEALAGLPAHLFVHVEVPLGEGLDDALAALGDARLGAKVRCGGVEASAFPGVERLAAFVQGCVREGLPFKATAGLHHAVRYTDPATGFDHHGFLNLLLATQRAVEARPTAEVVEALTSTDGEAMAREVTLADPLLDDQTREHLVAYGSCDTRAPLADLQSLGLA